MIAEFKPMSLIALLLSAVTIVALCCFTFTRAAEKSVREPEVEKSQEPARDQLEKGIRALEQKLSEHNARITKEQSEVDHLLNDLAVPAEIAEGHGDNLIDPQTIRELEGSRLKAEGESRGMTALLGKLKEKSSHELEQVINVAVPDQNLVSLLEAKARNQQQMAAVVTQVGSDNPEVKSLAASQAKIDEQIKNRITGIISGLELKTSAMRAQIESIAKTIDAMRQDALHKEMKYRPYFEAKKNLENMQRVRDALLLRILQERIDMQIPKQKLAPVQ